MTKYIVTWHSPWRGLHTITLVVISLGWHSIQKGTLLLHLLHWHLLIIVIIHHTHSAIHSVHLILVKFHHLIVVDKSVRSSLHILLRLKIAVLNTWKCIWRFHTSNCWVSLPRHRLKLPAVLFQVILNFLLCYFNLVFYIVVALVDVCYFLKSFQFILIIPITLRFSPIPIDDIKASWCT